MWLIGRMIRYIATLIRTITYDVAADGIGDHFDQSYRFSGLLDPGNGQKI